MVGAKTPYALQEFRGAATLFWDAHEKKVLYEQDGRRGFRQE
jgi:hypothetical protein